MEPNMKLLLSMILFMMISFCGVAQACLWGGAEKDEAAQKANFYEMDSNRDKVVSSKEYVSYSVSHFFDSSGPVTTDYAEQDFKSLDADHDGQVTLKEWMKEKWSSFAGCF